MNLVSKFRSNQHKFTLAAMTALALSVLPPSAMAAVGDLGDAAAAQLTGAQTIILGLLVTLVGIVFLFVIYSLIKRAKA